MKKPKQFRWALWWGLGIMAVSLVLIIIISLADGGGTGSASDITGPFTDALYRLIYQLGIWPIILYIGVIGPIIEEVCFRMWGDGKRWTGYTSVALMSLWGLSFCWWVGLLTLAAGIAIMVALRNDRQKRLFALMMLSTIVFALIHKGNYEGNAWMIALALLDKAGMGLVASYLVINHNLMWSIAFHILNNSIAAIPMVGGFNTAINSNTSAGIQGCSIDMHPILVKSKMPSTYTTGWLNDSTYCDINTIGNIAYSLSTYSHQNYCDTTGVPFYTCLWADYPLVDMTVTMRGDSVNTDAAILLMEEMGWIAIDTLPGEERDTIQFRTTYDPLGDL